MNKISQSQHKQMCGTNLFLYTTRSFHVSVSYALHSANRVGQISKDKTEMSYSYFQITESAQDVDNSKYMVLFILKFV